jgi:tetraprenyl-beta-curcumene synthase
VAIAARELAWGLRAVAVEIDKWERLAARIPDKPIRNDAFDALTRKRPHLDGAALFWTLPRCRDPRLIRALVGYELILEFLDNMNERASHAGVSNGQQLHLALIDALNPDGALSDYYRYYPWHDDGGYLAGLVQACQMACSSLPFYAAIRHAASSEARRAQVLALNHDPCPERRDRLLRAWAARECSEEGQANWFELSGAATASLTVHMLLALAVEPGVTLGEIQRACAVYRGVSLIATMLDSYVDRTQDAVDETHSYISHYTSDERLIARLSEIIRDGLSQARTLPNGHRHAVIVASMVALYLSSDDARNTRRREMTHALVEAGGSLTRLLVPILRAWRIAYGLCWA